MSNKLRVFFTSNRVGAVQEKQNLGGGLWEAWEGSEVLAFITYMIVSILHSFHKFNKKCGEDLKKLKVN